MSEAAESREWTVTLAAGDERVTEDVLALSRHAAAAAGEIMHPGFQAVAVTYCWPVTGRCTRCRSIVFNDEKFGLLRGRHVVCADC